MRRRRVNENKVFVYRYFLNRSLYLGLVWAQSRITLEIESSCGADAFDDRRFVHKVQWVEDLDVVAFSAVVTRTISWDIEFKPVVGPGHDLLPAFTKSCPVRIKMNVLILEQLLIRHYHLN